MPTQQLTSARQGALSSFFGQFSPQANPTSEHQKHKNNIKCSNTSLNPLNLILKAQGNQAHKYITLMYSWPLRAIDEAVFLLNTA